MILKPSIKISLATSEATQELGFRLAQQVGDRAIVALLGPLGAGKTTFAKGVGRALSVQEVVVSPTFTMVNEYISGRIPLYHLDLYRLSESGGSPRSAPAAAEEFLIAQLDEFRQERGLILIEWAGLLMPYIEQHDHIRLELSYEPVAIPAPEPSGESSRATSESAQQHRAQALPLAASRQAFGEHARVACLTARGPNACEIVGAVANVYFS